MKEDVAGRRFYVSMQISLERHVEWVIYMVQINQNIKWENVFGVNFSKINFTFVSLNAKTVIFLQNEEPKANSAIFFSTYQYFL